MRSAENHPGDRSLDVLGAVAIAAVTTLAAFTQEWPPWAYPAAGLMTAAWGAQSAAALDAGNHQPLLVTARRLVRVMAPAGLAGLITMAVLSTQGRPDLPAGAGAGQRWQVVLSWLLPLAEPSPGDPGYHELSGRLWLVRALVWLTILAPALVFCARKWPYRTAALVLALMAAAAAGTFGDQHELAAELTLSVAVLGGPWLLGVAHHDGSVRRWRLGWVIPAGMALVAGGLGYLIAFPPTWDTVQDGTSPGLGAAAALALGTTLLALRCTPTLTGLGAHPRASHLIGVLNRRMLTLYLWAGTCGYLTTLVPAPSWADRLPRPDTVWSAGRLAATWLGALAAATLLGWVEDVGAGRHPRLEALARWPGRMRASAAIRRPREVQ